MSNASTDLVTGIIKRALEFILKEVLPNAASVMPGPFGALLKAALGTQYVADLETKLGDEAAAWTGDKISALEQECNAWAEKEFSQHPAIKEFIEALKPPAPTQFNLKDDELKALLVAQGDGTLRAKLGLAP